MFRPGTTSNNVIAPLNEVPYVDHPELKINEHESTQMPFRYVKDEDGQPIMPEVISISLMCHSDTQANICSRV